MANLADILGGGATSAWVFAPTAVALGALHGLEPGHSKTMIAAFIVAIRGTLAQAVLLGLSATVSHTAVVWVVALAGLYLGSRWSSEASEPYLQIASGALILAVAVWMSWRTFSARRAADAGSHTGAQHAHRHGHHHHRGHHHHHRHEHGHVAAHSHKAADELLVLDSASLADPHERAHAEDINRRFAHRHVTTGQIVLFGLTGGLIPCPASITVLLLCLQLKQIALGAALVLCFSIGLALTMVLVGAAAALGVRHVSQRWSGFDEIAATAPYLSGALVSAVGLYTLYAGFAALA